MLIIAVFEVFRALAVVNYTEVEASFAFFMPIFGWPGVNFAPVRASFEQFWAFVAALGATRGG